MVDTLSIRVSSASNQTTVSAPVVIGIPFAAGELNHPEVLRLKCDETGENVPLQIKPLAYWPDNSVRWLKSQFIAVTSGPSPATYTLFSEDDTEKVPLEGARISEGSHLVEVTTQSGHRFQFDPKALSYTHQSSSQPAASQVNQLGFRLEDERGKTCQPILRQPWTVVENGPVCIRLEANGYWQTPEGDSLATFTCGIEIFGDLDTLAVDYCLHNPRRANHPGGLWDLGDSGSIHFNSLEAYVTPSMTGSGWIEPEPGLEPLFDDTALSIYQDSSGGEHWQSENHIDAKGQSTVHFCGYEVRRHDTLLKQGKRASPIAGLKTPGGTIQASQYQFWQNFPSAMNVSVQHLGIALFPAQPQQYYELQGGERKTQRFYLGFSDSPRALAWTHQPIVARIEAHIYERANAFPWFKANAPEDSLDQLIEKGLSGPDNFSNKREIIDEFGWRNFGDLFADHESLYRKEGERPFISHYNNQYDPTYGFIRQFALSRDSRWFELMDDLARHITDIDIYHTQEDRAEYNNGLFWHTDHYLDAHTATHRTFSRHNNSSSTPGQLGGGPGAEHCYTTGLLYHYFLTGNNASRQAVLELAQWMVNSHEGQGGLLEQLLALKKQELPGLKALVRGDKPLAHRYPFTRATGNYLNALLDAWHLTGDPLWKHRAEAVIHASIHPGDDPDQRNLLDVETGWSYLVLLSSITKYLWLKTSISEEDEAYGYTLRALRRYTRWMLKHEHPFLSDPKVLEFPNDTWVAQDIRKAMLMYQAAYYDPAQAPNYREKADTWFRYVTETLEKSDEAHFTRILVILMQNHGPQHFRQWHGKEELIEDSPPLAPPFLSWPKLISRITYRLIRGMLTFRPAHERAWLKARLDRS